MIVGSVFFHTNLNNVMKMATNQFRMDSFIQVLAHALDMVEIVLLGASTHHGKRIAALCGAMGRRLEIGEDRLSGLVSCAMLHDNALTESESVMPGWAQGNDTKGLSIHSEIGQRNIEVIPFRCDTGGFIRYHHEYANGRGPFGLSEGYCPLEAELIAIADMVDVQNHLQRFSPKELPALRDAIAADIHHRFTGRAGGAMLDILNEEMLVSLRDENIEETIRRSIPFWQMDMGNTALIPIAHFVARIIDYKSAFTMLHTTQIANRAWVMAEYYGYDLMEKIQLFLAASLHDIGKLAVPSEILEKPGKLDNEEFGIIKSHVSQTREIMSAAEGMELITEWAANHHEKLDGSGYPFGKTADDLDHNSRLMACIDIYQAVCEERPYHPRRSHAETMPVLYSMAEKGGIDSDIVNDMNTVMEPYSGMDLPPPSLN